MAYPVYVRHHGFFLCGLEVERMFGDGFSGMVAGASGHRTWIGDLLLTPVGGGGSLPLPIESLLLFELPAMQQTQFS